MREYDKIDIYILKNTKVKRHFFIYFYTALLNELHIMMSLAKYHIN